MRVAITGNIGSGKSTALQLIKDKGFQVVDVDKINALNLERKEVRKRIREMLGLKHFTKKQVSNIIFNDANKRIELENYLYPLIIEKVICLGNDSLVFVEVPLLFEKNWLYLFDSSVLIYANKEEMYKRLTNERGMSIQEIDERLKNQMDIEEKKKLADIVIDNSGTLIELEEQIDIMIRKLGF